MTAGSSCAAGSDGIARWCVTGRAADPSEAARQADPASRRHAAARSWRRPCCPGSRCSEIERRDAAHGAAAGRRQLRQGRALPGARPRPGRSAAAGEPARRGRRLRRAGRRAASRPAGCWSSPTRPARRPSRTSPASRPGTSTPSPGSTSTATCGCSSSSAGRCRRMPRWPRSPARCSGTCPRAATTTTLRGVRMRDGSSRAVRVRAHADDKAELLRAAICDDEVIQAIGRGRGVNRTRRRSARGARARRRRPAAGARRRRRLGDGAARPVQRMLLAGIAVDSPGDAALLHPGLFTVRASRRKKAFRASGFKRTKPYKEILYREMSLKSAAYRRPGRGRSWQRAWWIDGDADAARSALEAALGALAEWQPDP